MKKNTILKLLVFSLFITLGCIFGSSAKVAADSYCAVLAPPVNPITTPPHQLDDNCLAGQEYDASDPTQQTVENGVDLSTATNAQLESTFITNVINYSNSEYNFQKVGALYIENALGGPSLWQLNISASDVTFVVDPNYSFPRNTGYDPATNMDESIDTPDTAQAVVVKVNGVAWFAVKLDCGNSVGNFPTFPPAVKINVLKVDTNSEWSSSSPSDGGPFNQATITMTSPIIPSSSPTNNNNVSWTLTSGDTYTATAQAQSNSNSIGSWTLKGYSICTTSSDEPCTPVIACDTGSSCNTVSIPTSGTENIYLDWIYQNSSTGNFNITGTGTVAPNPVAPGGTANFSFNLTNTGTAASTPITYKVYLTVNNGTPKLEANTVGSLTFQSGIIMPDDDAVPIPGSAVTGDQYCDTIYWSPTATGNTSQSDYIVCDVVQAPGGGATISGTVYYVNASGQTIKLATVAIFNCYNDATNTPTTGPSGQPFSSPIPIGTQFCIRAGAESAPYIWVASDGTKYSDPVITPNSTNGTTTSGCTSSSYEEQTAGASSSDGNCHPTSNSGYDIMYQVGSPPTGPTITGTVYYYNGTGSLGLAGVPIYDCYDNVTNESSTNGAGQFTIVLPTGTPFCIRAGGTTAPYIFVSSNDTTYSDPVITPGYVKPNPVPGGVNTSCTVNGITNTASYEFQNASFPSSGTSKCNYGLNNMEYDIAFTKAVPPSPGTNPTSLCPTLPVTNITASGAASVQITDTTPSIATAAGINGHYLSEMPSGDTTASGQTWYDDTPSGTFSAISATDTSTGGNQLFKNDSSKIKSAGRAFTDASGSGTATVTVDYSLFITDYPYDNDNVATVNYNSDYTEVKYVSSSSVDYYLCSDGSKPTSPGSCSASGTCTKTVNSVCTKCSAGTVPTCGYTYTGTPYYAWDSGSSPVSETVSGPATPGPILPECFDRTFSISPGAVAPQFDDYENPTAITYNGSVPIQYGVVPASGDNPIGLRIASKVNGIQSDLGIIVQPMNGPTPVLGAQYPLPFNSSSITGGTYYQPNGGSTTPTFTGNFTGNETDTLTESDPAAFEASYTIPTADLIGGSDSSKAFHYGDEVCAALVVDPGSYQMDATGKITVDNGSVATNPPQVCSKPLAAEPYLKAYGGDVSAGTTGDVDMDIGCNPADDVGDICSWNKGGTSSYAGAGTELAAFAFNVIDGFASAQNVSQTGLSPLPLGLTFANNPSGNFDYGGDFGANSSNNTANYFTQGSTAANTVTSTSASLALTMAQTMRASIGNPVNIAFSVPGGGIIGSESGPPIVIQPDYNITIYSNGPITIASNISYGGPLTNNPADMPNLEIVTNNAPINIDSTVTQLAGVYVAEGAGGIIDDCADQASTPTSWFTDCNQKLTVNGSFTANALDLDRTYDSLHQATPTEISGSSNAAEEFNYSPIVWLTYPNQNVSPVVQAVTSLPPIL